MSDRESLFSPVRQKPAAHLVTPRFFLGTHMVNWLVLATSSCASSLREDAPSPRQSLAEVVERVREMRRLYPFTYFESSAAKKARKARKG